MRAASRASPPTQQGQGVLACRGKSSAERIGPTQADHGVGFPGKATSARDEPNCRRRPAWAADSHVDATSTQIVSRVVSEIVAMEEAEAPARCLTQPRARGSWRMALASHTVWWGMMPAQGRQPREPSAVGRTVPFLPQLPHTAGSTGQTVMRSTQAEQTTSQRPTAYHSAVDSVSSPEHPHSWQ